MKATPRGVPRALAREDAAVDAAAVRTAVAEWFARRRGRIGFAPLDVATTAVDDASPTVWAWPRGHRDAFEGSQPPRRARTPRRRRHERQLLEFVRARLRPAEPPADDDDDDDGSPGPTDDGEAAAPRSDALAMLQWPRAAAAAATDVPAVSDAQRAADDRRLTARYGARWRPAGPGGDRPPPNRGSV